MYIVTLAALAALALACAGGAAAGLSFGVTDDAGKYADDGGGNFFAALSDFGGTENRVTVLWDPTDGNRGFTIRDGGFLDRAVPIAALRGVDVVLSVYPAQPRAFTVDTQNRISLFAQFLQSLARRYPSVRAFIVGNEPNQPRFLQPQFVRNGRGGYRAVGAVNFERVLAASYDALNEVDPTITVVGLGLSPRGNDDPRARDNVSRSPVRFIAELAAEYRRSGRSRPIMDELGYHPYPQSNDDPFSRGYSWPGAGLTNLDRIKQAVWDGFHGTAQPVFAESDSPRAVGAPLTFNLDEYGRQVQVISSVRRIYTGRENVRTVSEAAQARLYVAAVSLAECDPAISDLFFFHLRDETSLERFQSGLLRADGTRRPSYDAVRAAIASTGGSCGGRPHAWHHASSVLGGDVTFSADGRSAAAGASEDVTATGGIFPATVGRQEIEAALAGRPATVRASARRLVRAYRARRLAFDLHSVAPGSYVAAVLVRATLGPQRSLLATSEPFELTG